MRHKDIVHVEAEGSYTTLHLANGRRITMSKNLKRVEEMLNNEMFFRHAQQPPGSTASGCVMQLRQRGLGYGAVVPMAVRKREALKQRLSLLVGVNVLPQRPCIFARMSQGQPDIRSLSQAELTQALVEMGEKPFRTKQVSEWLWTHAAGSFGRNDVVGQGLEVQARGIVHPQPH